MKRTNREIFFAAFFFLSIIQSMTLCRAADNPVKQPAPNDFLDPFDAAPADVHNNQLNEHDPIAGYNQGI